MILFFSKFPLSSPLIFFFFFFFILSWIRSLSNDEGKNAQVFRGMYRESPVAVKVFAIEQSLAVANMDQSKAVANNAYLDFMREVGLMGSLRHRNLCLIEAAAVTEDKFILVMEMMETSLRSYVLAYGAPLPTKDIKSISTDICRGMLALHLK